MTMIDDLSHTLTEFFTARVGAVKNPWEHVLDGFLVRVHVRGWTGKTTLSAEDFGFPAHIAEKIDKRIQWGSLYLIEPETAKRLTALGIQARRIAAKWSREVHWGSFIPVSAMPVFKEEFEAVVQEHKAIVQEWQNTYDETLKDTQTRIYGHINWAQRIAEQFSHTLNEDEIYTRLIASYPDRSTLLERFSIDYELSYIPTPQIVAQQAAEVERIQLDALREIEKRKAEIQKERDIEELERMQRLNALDMEQTRYQERLRIIQQENAKFQKNLEKEKRAVLDAFYKGYALEIRQRLHGALMYLVEGVKKGKVSPSASRSLRTVLQEIEHLALEDDREIHAMKKHLEHVIAGEQIRPHHIQESVEDLSLILQTEITALGGMPRIPRRGKQAIASAFEGIEDHEPLIPRITEAKRRQRLHQCLAEELLFDQDTVQTLRKKRVSEYHNQPDEADV